MAPLSELLRDLAAIVLILAGVTLLLAASYTTDVRLGLAVTGAMALSAGVTAGRRR